jgi:hypothetical protein
MELSACCFHKSVEAALSHEGGTLADVQTLSAEEGMWLKEGRRTRKLEKTA